MSLHHLRAWYAAVLPTLTNSCYAAMLATLFAVAACRGDRASDAARAGERASVETTRATNADTVPTGYGLSLDSLRDDLVEHGLLVPERRADVVARLGRPDSVVVHPERNRHYAERVDSIFDLFYPGLHVTYYAVTEDSHDFIMSALVASNRYLKYPRLGIGASTTELTKVLGEPSDREEGKFRYDCWRCVGYESPVYFHVRRNRVWLIEYTFASD